MVTVAADHAYFTSAAAMVSNLQSAHLRNDLEPSVLVIDEVGYLSQDQSSANGIFQVVGRRYEKTPPIVLTSNRRFADWDHACVPTKRARGLRRSVTTSSS